MFARTIKKALLFFVVDVLIIIGIFVLQFSNDSIITEKNGNLQITLSETKDNNNNTILKNKFNLTFNGITLSCDDTKPAEIKRKGAEEKEAVTLINWQKMDDQSYVFEFTEGVNLHVDLTDSTEKGAVSFLAEFTGDSSGKGPVEEFYMPYALAANSEISEESLSRIVLGNKKNLWELSAYSLDSSVVRFTRGKPLASFAYFEQTVEFTFASLGGSALVDNYDFVVSAFRDSVVSSFKANTTEALGNEEAVVAYIAEQGSRGNYRSAVDEIPQSFKRSSNRTYLSAPYFNNLIEMNKTLEAELNSKESLIRKSVSNYGLSLYTIRNIAQNMYLYPNSTSIKRITEYAGEAEIGNASLAEAAGILRTYVEMMSLSKAYASHMEGRLKECVTKIEKSCKMEGNNLTLQENGTFLSVVQAVEVGDALLRYGKYVGDQSFIAGGKAIIASYMAESSSFDIRTLSDLYPVIVKNNTYYPHFVKLYTSGDNVVWAWTVAEKLGYERGDNKTLSINIDFPSGDTHYLIVRGIEAFRSIYIYDIAFRTDPRFESYNSSGYVYDAETKGLLLKSRQKAETETIRLQFGTVPVVKPVEKAEETPAAGATETKTETTTEIKKEEKVEASAGTPVETKTEAPAESKTETVKPAVPSATQQSEAALRSMQMQAQQQAQAQQRAQAERNGQQ